MFKRSLVLSLAAVSAILALGCQPAQPVPLGTPKAGETPAQKPAAAAVATTTKAAEKPVRGGTLRYASDADPDTIDPHLASSSVQGVILFDSLIWEDENLNLTKDGLAKDWSFSSDGKAITFKLREGVKFHDGTDLDAAVVKFNVDRQKDPATKAVYRTAYDSVASVEVVDNLTVRFNLKQPDPLLLTRLSYQGGLMVSPAAVRKYGKDFGRHPVGTGPFQFVEWVLGDHITLKRFEGYWKKDKDGNQLPYLDQVVYKVVTDQSVVLANLRTGQLDFYGPSGAGFPPAQLALVKADPNLAYMSKGRADMVGVYLNTKRPPFDNKALRQAVALALDREGIVSVRGETATLQASILHPMNVQWGADPKIGVFPSRDLAKAKAKMAEAGYPAGGLNVKLNTSTGGTSVQEAEVIKANLVEIGIVAEIEVLNSVAHQTRVRIEQNYQISSSNSGYGSGVADPGQIFSIGFHSKGSRNYYGPYSNPKVDEAIDKAGSIYDQKERVALYNEAAKMIADDMPFLPLYVGNDAYLMNKKVRNFVPYPIASNVKHFRQVWLAP